MLSRNNYYAILKGHQVSVLSGDGATITWSEWFEKNQGKRRVALTRVGDYEVSTVFLGLNHAYPEGPDLWFETLIFGETGQELDESCWRYETWEQAEAGHEAAVKRLLKKTVSA